MSEDNRLSTKLNGLGENLAAVVRDQHEIFNAHAAPAFNVDARLYAGDHARLERDAGPTGCSPAQEWRLMEVHANAVACSVAEVVAVARCGDEIASDGVYLVGAHARPHLGDGSLLRF